MSDKAVLGPNRQASTPSRYLIRPKLQAGTSTEEAAATETNLVGATWQHLRLHFCEVLTQVIRGLAWYDVVYETSAGSPHDLCFATLIQNAVDPFFCIFTCIAFRANAPCPCCPCMKLCIAQ